MTVAIDVGDVLEILGLVGRSQDGRIAVDTAWFDDPFGAMARVLTDDTRREKLSGVLAAALGGLGGIAESPAGAGPDGERWTPLVGHLFPGAMGGGTSVALALVTTPYGPGTVEVGVGVRVTLRPSADLLAVRLAGLVPLARVTTRQGGTRPVTTAAPVAGTLRVALGAGPLGDPASVGMTAADLTLAVPLDGSGAPRLRLSTSGLHAGGAPVTDLDLDLTGEPAETGAAVIAFLLRLARAGAGSDLFGSVLDVAGLGESVGIPAFDLDDLLAGGPTSPGRAWLAALLRTPPPGVDDPLLEWLTALASVATDLAPAGTAVVLTEPVPGAAFELRVGAFRLTVNRRPEGVGERAVVRLAVTTPQPPVPADPDEPGGPRAAVRLELLSVLLDAAGAPIEVRPGSSLEATVTAGLPTHPLLTDPIRVGVVRAGLAADPVAGLRPVVELLGVTIEDDEYERLDLTSAEVRQAVAGSVLGALVEDLAGPRARAAAVLLGLAEPETPPASAWPPVPDPALLTAPLDALARFARALATDRDRWHLLLAHVPVLLGNAAAPAPAAVTGDGGADTPDEVVLCTDADLGSIVLRTWRDADAVRFGLAVRAPRLGTGPTVGLALTADLFRLDLPPRGVPHLALTPHTGLDVTFASDDPVALGVAELGPLRATLGIRVDVGTGRLTSGLALAATAFEVNGVTTPLAPLRIDGDTAAGLDVVGEVPWDALELLSGAALCALDDDPPGPGTVLAALAGWAPWLPAATVTLPGTFADVPVRVALGGFPVLSLAALVADPGDAVRTWARRLAGDEDDAPPVFAAAQASLPDGDDVDPDPGAADAGDSWVLPEDPDPGKRDRAFGAALLLSTLLPGGTSGTAGLRAPLAGLGTRADPWLLPVTSAGAASAALAVWLRRARPPKPPAEIAAAMDGAGEPAGLSFGDRLARVTRLAASFAPELAADLGDPAAAAALLGGLVDAVAGTDGVTPATAQTSTPELVHSGGHLGVPGRLGEIVAGLGEPVARERAVLVAPDLAGLAPWDLGGPPAARIVLGEPLPTALPAAGPWTVAVPEQAGATDAARTAAAATALADVVRAVAAASPAGSPPLTVVALGTAGRAARQAASALGGLVGTVMLIATPWTASPEPAVPAHAVELLLRLRRAAAPAPAATPETAVAPATAPTPATELMDTLVAARTGWVAAGPGRLERHPFPVVGYRSPDAAAAATVRELEVAVAVTRDELRAGLLTLVTDAALAEITADAEPGAAQGFGVGVRVAGAGGPGGLRLAPAVRLDLPGVAIDAAPGRAASVDRAHWLQADLRLGDDDGWLAGDDAADVGRPPATARVARATLRLAHDPVDGRSGADLVVRHAEAFGDRFDTLAIGLDDGRPDLVRLTAAERALVSRTLARVGELLPATGAPPDAAAGPVTALAGLLADLGLLVRSGADVVAPVDAVERFLTDPATALAGLRATATAGLTPGVAATVAARVATLLGIPATAAGSALTLGAGPGDVALVLDLAAPSLGASPALPVGPLALAVTAQVTLPGASLTCDVELGAPDAPTLRVTVDGSPDAAGPMVRADVVLPAALAPGGAAVPLLPEPALDATVGRALLGEIARALLDGALGTAPDRLQPLFTALGLVDAGSTRCRSPLPMLLDPLAWLARPEVLGTAGSATGTPPVFDLTRVAALVAAVPAAFGVPAGTPVGLPGGGALVLTTTGARPGAALSWQLPGGRVSLGVVRVAGAWEGAVQVSGTLPIEGAGPLRSIGLDAALAGGVPDLTVVVTTAGGTARFGVLPVRPFDATAVGELAAGAAALVVPAVLDALADEAPPDGQAAVTPREWTGRALAGLGDALGIRVAGAFSSDRLTAFRTDPGTFLAGNFDPAAALEALAGVLEAALPDVASTDGAALVLTLGDAKLRLTPRGHVVDAALSLGVTTAQVRVDLSARITGDAGFAAAAAAVRFTGDLLAVGRVILHPEVSLDVGRSSGGVHVTGALALPVERHRLTLTVDSASAVALSCVHGTGPGAAQVAAGELPGCLLDVARAVVVPILMDIVLDDDDLQAWLRAGARPRVAPLEGSFLERVPAVPEPPPGQERFHRRDDALAAGRLLPNVAEVLRKLADRLGVRALELGEFVAVGIATGSGDRFGAWVGLRMPLELVTTESLDISIRAAPGAAEPAAGGGRITLLLVGVTPPGPGETLPRIALRPEVAVSGVGLRVGGAGTAPLLAGGVVSLGALGLYSRRAGPGDWSVELDVEGLGIGLGSAGKGNAVATNLLAPPAGSDKAAAAPGEASPTAPAVDVVLTAGPHGVGVGLRGDRVFPVWLPIQRSFGPLHIDQIGVDVDPPPGAGVRLTDLTIAVLLDGSLLLGPLAAVVDNLRLSVPLRDPRPAQWSVGVDGFAVSMDGEAVRIAGGLRRPPAGDGDYLGFLSLQVASFGISLFGGYGRYPAAAPEYTSLFVFGALRAPLGGPPPFFLTGIGAGAGVNRGLVSVPIEKVETHPMVGALWGTLSAQDTFSSLVGVFPPARGSYWFAAGVSFTTFVFIESVAVLTVQFDPEGFEIGLMGVSSFALPAGEAPVANIEVALDGRFSSKHKSLIAQAAFTGNSWIVDPGCRITGGIAIGFWFGDGDFVITLGGYHPNFPVPVHYPVPRRLGIEWRPTDGVVISAQGYFALTPRAVMTGAELEVAVESDWFGLSLKAWFHALLQWDPFHYELTIGICISGWARLGPIEVSATVGAEVTLSGPPLRVTGHIRLGPVSIPFEFGDTGPSARTPLTWDEFRAKYLDDGGRRPPLDVVVASGRPDPQSTADGRTKPWRVLPEFTLTTKTALPCTQLNGTAAAGAGTLGVPSMWVTAYTGVHEVHVVVHNGPAANVGGVSILPVTEAQPVAAFGSFGLIELIEGRLGGHDVSVTAVTGAVVRTQRQLGTSLRVRSGTLESPLVRPSPFAFADPAGPDVDAPSAERPAAPWTVAAVAAPQPAPVPAQAEAAAPPVAPSLETVVPVSRPAVAGAMDRTTVSGAPDLPRVAAPRLADVVGAASRAGVLTEVRGGLRLAPGTRDRAARVDTTTATPAEVAATTVTGVAERLPVWRAADRRTPIAPGTLVAGDGTKTLVALRAATVWRAGADAGVLRWDADAPARVMRISRAGAVTADERAARGQLDLPPGASAVVLGSDATPATVAAGWFATDPVVRLDPVTGLIPGGVLHALGVPGSAGAGATGPLPAGARIAVAATSGAAVSAVAVLFATPVDELPDGVQLTVAGSAPEGWPLVVPTPDDGTALVWPVVGTSGSRGAPVQAVLDAARNASTTPNGLVLGTVTPEQFTATVAAVPAGLLTGAHRTAGSALLSWEATP